MIKQKWCLLLLLLFAGHVQAQITMALQVPPAGVVQKSQLWNMILVNNSSNTYYAEVNITLLSTVDNNPVMTVASRQVAVTKGVHQLKYTDFAPVSFKYLSPAFNSDLRPDGFIPVGSYTACYTVSCWVGDMLQPMAEDCVSLEVQPLSPPILNTPVDKDTIQTAYPQFTWMPPAPLSFFSDLSYDFVLVKVLPDQSAVQAIQQNVPVYNQSRVKQPFFSMPASTKGLDTGTVYAWSVVAKNSGQFVALSETYTFKRTEPVLTKVVTTGSAFVQLKRGEDAGAIASTGIVQYNYNNLAGDAAVNYTVRDVSDQSNKLMYSGVVSLSGGTNFITLDLSKSFTVENGHTYVVILVNSRGEKWTLKCLYQSK